jgi:hypothetical protein
MKEYTIQSHPKKTSGYWTQAAGYLYYHKILEAAKNHAALINWTSEVSVWDCKTWEVA